MDLCVYTHLILRSLSILCHRPRWLYLSALWEPFSISAKESTDGHQCWAGLQCQVENTASYSSAQVKLVLVYKQTHTFVFAAWPKFPKYTLFSSAVHILFLVEYRNLQHKHIEFIFQTSPVGNGYDPQCLRAPQARPLLFFVQLSVDSVVPEASPSGWELFSPHLWSALSPPNASFQRSAAVGWRSSHCPPQTLVQNAIAMTERVV